jgi:hypothetical protein
MRRRTGLKQNNKGARARREGCVWKGVAAGVCGGLVASLTMNQFQALWSKLAGDEWRSHGAQSLQQGSPRQGIGRELQAQGKDEARDDAAGRLANAISVGISGQELTKREKEVAGTALHYGMGAASGALYGGVAEIIPQVKVCAGLPFGVAVWLIADEGIVPAAGLSKSSAEYPLWINAYAFASHLVFGLTTEVVRHAVRKAL